MRMQKKARVSVKGSRGSYKVFVTDRYGTAPYSGFSRKTKRSAEQEARRAKRWVKF